MRIRTWQQRCEEHPDHNGIVSEGMIQARMQEEIDELRDALEQTQTKTAPAQGGLAEKVPARGTLLEQTLGKVWDEMPHAALMDAIIGGTGVMLGDKRIDPASIYKQPEQEPVAHSTGHCEHHKQKGGCQLHNLQCGWPDCDRKPISMPPQMQPCAGRNCGSTNPNLHSAECFEDYEKATGMNQRKPLMDDFWDWLPKAYGDVGDEPAFTKYNMEVAFAAGAEAEAKRMWVGLTDEEIWALAANCLDSVAGRLQFARAIEAKLQEKNI